MTLASKVNMEESLKSKTNIRLNELPKKNILEAPERYFDELPLKIQRKVSKSKQTTFGWVPALKWVPALILVVLVSWWWLAEPEQQIQAPTFEEQLALITDEEIISFLEESELSTEDILETISASSMILDDKKIEEIIDEEIINDELEELINNSLSIEEYYN